MSKIDLKTTDEIHLMRAGGKIAARVLNTIGDMVKPGISTKELDTEAEKMIRSTGAEPSFKNYHGYPAATCISINNEVVHGIPSDCVITEGDIVGIDVGVYYKGFHTDTAKTVAVGKISPEAQKLISITKKSLKRGIAIAKVGAKLGDIQSEIQHTLETANLGIIRDLTGHGIGRKLQESPSIPNYGQKGIGMTLKEGMTLAIEPMATLGREKVEFMPDGWTIVTADNSLSAHFEHTIVITKDGAEILTQE